MATNGLLPDRYVNDISPAHDLYTFTMANLTSCQLFELKGTIVVNHEMDCFQEMCCFVHVALLCTVILQSPKFLFSLVTVNSRQMQLYA